MCILYSHCKRETARTARLVPRNLVNTAVTRQRKYAITPPLGNAVAELVVLHTRPRIEHTSPVTGKNYTIVSDSAILTEETRFCSALFFVFLEDVQYT